YDAGLDSLVLPLHNISYRNKFLDNFKNVNYLGTELSTDIASFGFRADDLYFSFDITQRALVDFSYPGDLMKMLFSGIGKSEYDLSGLGFSSRLFSEFSMGVSNRFSDDFFIGVRGKILFGAADFSVANTNITIQADTFSYNVHSELTGNLNVPYLNIPRDENGDFDLANTSFDVEDALVADHVRNVLGNPGLALDIGAHYAVTDKIMLSASLIDIGLIRWRSNYYNISQNTDFEFQGIETSFIDSLDIMEEFLDTMQNRVTLNYSENPYTTFLPTKIYLGGRYFLTEKVALGLLSRTEIKKGKLRESLTLSANFYPIKMFSATLSYSIMNNTYNNFGLGISTKLGPLNLYAVSDLVPYQFAPEPESGAPLIPLEAKSFNFRFGLNLMFGCRQKIKDYPLID
ncbi:MAG: DUF5723 family protein, partial [Bacteroidota bacterium]